MKIRDITGQRFGKLIAIKRLGSNKRRISIWECKCDCGKIKNVPLNDLAANKTKSCGCLSGRALPVNHSFFKTWTQEMAWLLGFWAADGCAKFNGCSYYISFAQKNRPIIEQIKRLLESEHKIYETKNDAFILEFASKEMYNDLCAIFGTSKLTAKSSTIPFPTLPANYASDFLRGVVDGDGCLHYNSREVPGICLTTGSKSFAYSFHNCILEHFGIKGSVRPRDKNAFIVCYYAKNAKELSRILYSNCSIALARKKKLAQEFLEYSSRK